MGLGIQSSDSANCFSAWRSCGVRLLKLPPLVMMLRIRRVLSSPSTCFAESHVLKDAIAHLHSLSIQTELSAVLFCFQSSVRHGTSATLEGHPLLDACPAFAAGTTMTPSGTVAL